MAWAPDYATTTQLKGWVRIGDEFDDVELASIISATSRLIDRACGRQFGQVATVEARVYEAQYARTNPGSGWVLEIDDLGTIAGLIVTVDGTAVTNYTLEPRNALLKGRVYTRLVLDSDAEALTTASENAVTVTARWGWPSVPTTILQALKLQGARLSSRRDAPMGIAGSPDQGTEVRLLARLDPDVELMLKDYQRRWYAA